MSILEHTKEEIADMLNYSEYQNRVSVLFPEISFLKQFFSKK